MGSKHQSLCALFVLHGDIVEVLCNCSTKSLVITQGVFVECLISSIRKSDIFYSFHISEHLQSFSPNLASFWSKLRLFFLYIRLNLKELIFLLLSPTVKQMSFHLRYQWNSNTKREEHVTNDVDLLIKA